MKLIAGLSVVTVLTLAACGSDDAPAATTGAPATTAAPTTTTVVAAGEAVSIVEVIDGYEYYNPCQNSEIEVNGVTYYSVPDGFDAGLGEYPEIDESRYPLPDEPQGFARIMPPGPGDDVGTMILYSDGIARYESDSGMVSWFTTDELTYSWVC